MIRFLLILLLTSVSASQVFQGWYLTEEVDVSALCMSGEENEGENTNKPDFKGQWEDKLHNETPDLYAFLTFLEGNLAPGAQSLYLSYYDQPVTPPPITA